MEEIQESVWRAKSEICLTPSNLNSMQVNQSFDSASTTVYCGHKEGGIISPQSLQVTGV